ncbi:hypothetical protein [Cohnella soli]|uniref:Butirosin biosynthesis protein H N-terminal domain-containing protein n=1 Tax=Cohnella soli TaxID=425005 RepID=A0ABW0I431_9BACL
MSFLQLPVERSPGFISECYHNIRLSIVQSEGDWFPWFYSHFDTLLYHFDGENFPIIQFEDHLNIYRSILRETPLDEQHHSVDRLIQCLHAGSYILVFLNWRYVEEFNRFGVQEDAVHETLIYGCDKENKCFLALAFETNGHRYGPFTISFAKLTEELTRLLNHAKNETRWLHHYGYPISSIVPDRQFLSAFALDTRKLFFSLNRRRIPVDSETSKTAPLSYGHHIFLGFANYFNTVNDISKHDHETWNIMIHKIMLCNKMTLNRVAYMEGTRTGSDPSLSRLILKLAESERALLLAIRSLSLKYQSKPEKGLLKEVSERFMKIYELEKKSLPLLLQFFLSNGKEK